MSDLSATGRKKNEGMLAFEIEQRFFAVGSQHNKPYRTKNLLVSTIHASFAKLSGGGNYPLKFPMGGNSLTATAKLGF